MNITHTSLIQTDELSGMNANADLPFFGRHANLSISVYSQPGFHGRRTRVAVGFKPKPAEFFRFRNHRHPDHIVEQELLLPEVSGTILQWSYLMGAGEDAGRFVAGAILRCYESLLEKARQSVSKNLASDFAEYIVSLLRSSYSRLTMDALAACLGSINWQLLFMQTEMDQRTRDVIDYTLRNNRPRLSNLLDDDRHIPFRPFGVIYVNHNIDALVGNLERFDDDAGHRATDMLQDVLGEEQATTFKSQGFITVEKNGYTFQLKPGFIPCTDPLGGTAELCIHTASLCCHPIDEIVIAALNIEHYFDEFMRKAIMHRTRNFHWPHQLPA